MTRQWVPLEQARSGRIHLKLDWLNLSTDVVNVKEVRRPGTALLAQYHSDRAWRSADQRRGPCVISGLIARFSDWGRCIMTLMPTLHDCLCCRRLGKFVVMTPRRETQTPPCQKLLVQNMFFTRAQCKPLTSVALIRLHVHS